MPLPFGLSMNEEVNLVITRASEVPLVFVCIEKESRVFQRVSLVDPPPFLS